MSSITHINPQNANILSEGVLLCTLSYLTNNVSEEQKKRPEHQFDMLLDYVNTNYRDPDLSLKKIAGIFSYTEKYISHLFKKKMNVGFNQYLNDLRIQYAYDLFATGVQSVSEIAVRCGYSDPLYFSKVFKKRVGLSPTEYMNQKKGAPYGALLWYVYTLSENGFSQILNAGYTEIYEHIKNEEYNIYREYFIDDTPVSEADYTLLWALLLMVQKR